MKTAADATSRKKCVERIKSVVVKSVKKSARLNVKSVARETAMSVTVSGARTRGEVLDTPTNAIWIVHSAIWMSGIETVITIGNLPEALCMESFLRASQLLLGHILLPPPDIHPAARMLPRLLHRTLLPHLDMPLRDKPIQVPMEHNQWLLVLSPRTKPHLLLLVPFHHTRYLVQFLLPALHLHTHLHLGQPHPMRLLPLEQLRLMHRLLVLHLRTHLLHPFALRRLTNQVQSFLRLLLGLLTRLLGLSQVFTPPGMSWKAVQLAVLLLLLHMGQPRQVATPPQGTLPLALGMLLTLLVPHTRLLRFLELSVPTRLRLVRKSRRCLHLRDSAVRQTWRSRIRGSRR